jgi:hypothetical protein
MQPSLINALRMQRPHIRSRWEDLLRAERVGSPLGNPDVLVHLLDWTFNEIFRSLEELPSRRRSSRDNREPHCPCGRNPLLAYFAAGEQALQESLVLAQVSEPNLTPAVRDVALIELNHVLEKISRREIEAFCAVCQFRDRPALSSSSASELRAQVRSNFQLRATP